MATRQPHRFPKKKQTPAETDPNYGCKGVVLNFYQIPWQPAQVGLGNVFTHRESRILWLAVRSTHRVSEHFTGDVMRVAAQFRKHKPKDAETFEKMLWAFSTDPSLKCPWRPVLRPYKLLDKSEQPITETPEEYDERFQKERKLFLSRIEELRLAMLGKREKPVTYKVVAVRRNN